MNFSIKSSVVRKWLEENGVSIAFGNTPINDAAKDTLKDGLKTSEAVKADKTLSMPLDSKRQTQAVKFNTEKRPYDYDALFKAAEKDLEGMMEEMRGGKK